MRTKRKRNRRLECERLETRVVLHAEGLAWPSPESLTISFAPNGTDIAGHENVLEDHFTSLGEASQWQDEIVRAFRTWGALANIGITVVDDSGDEFGATGPTQGDSRFGDIRVGAVPLSGEVIAISAPHTAVVSGTWAGDVLFNGDQAVDSLTDLYAIALHEAGHVFGLTHSTDPLSPMFTHGIPDSVVPTAADIDNIHDLYEMRIEGPDPSGSTDDDDDDDENKHDNDEYVNANAVQVQPIAENATQYETNGRIDAANDVDFFQLGPSTARVEDLETLTVIVRTDVGDSLMPRVAIHDERGEEVDATIIANGDGVIILQTGDAKPEDAFYVSVRAAVPAADTLATGGYELEAAFSMGDVELDELTSGKLTVGEPSRTQAVRVETTKLAHFVLEVKPVGEESNAVVWAVLYDVDGEDVLKLATTPGETRSSLAVLLPAGDYRVDFQTGSAEGEVDHELEYGLQINSTTFPIGPLVVDTTLTPLLPCANAGADPNFCRPTTTGVTDPVILPTPMPPKTNPVVNVPLPPWTQPDLWFWTKTPVKTPVAEGEPVDAPSPHHNQSYPEDVNRDGALTSVDVFLAIDYYRRATHGETTPAGLLCDFDNDNEVGLLDLFGLITALRDELHP